MKKTLHALLTLMLLAISAVGFADDQTYTLDYPLNKNAGGSGFWNSDKNVTTQTATINGIEWTLVSDSYYMGYSANNGQQIGSATYPAHHATISTEGIEGVVKSVAVTARCKDGSTTTVSVIVGGEKYLYDSNETSSLSKDNTEFLFTTDNAKSGKIELVFDQADDSKAAAIYLIKAVIVFDPDASAESSYEEATWTYEWNKTKNNGGEGFYNFGSTFTEVMPLQTTINGLTWYAQAEGTKKFAMTASGGQTIGTGATDYATHAEFWTEDIDGKVTDITVNARLNKAEYSGHVKVSVGGVSYLYNGSDQADISNEPTDYTFVAPEGENAEGKILIELFQTSETGGTLYLKRVDINYLKPTSDNPQPEAPADPVIARTGEYNSDYMFADEDITITTETEGATIYYTLDAAGTESPKDPVTSEERLEYTAPITITKSTLVRAVAVKDDVYSNIAERTFTMWKNPQLFFEGYQDEATVQVGYVGIPVPVSNPFNVGPLNWNSENEEIATVDADGTIHAIKEGQVNINFYFDGNDEYLEMGGRLKLTVEPAATYTEGMYTHVWDKSKSDGGEGFYNFGTDFVDTNTLTRSLNGVNWTVTTVGSKKMAYTANYGQTFGVGTSDPCSHIELTTSDLPGEITQVIVSARKGTTSADLSNASIKVSVNGVDYLCNGEVSVPMTGEFTEYSFVPESQPQEGEIKIEMNQDSETQVALAMKSIVVNYRQQETGIEAPKASVEAGSYDDPISVELTAQEGATILYTTDGTNPKNSETAQEYSEAINISENTTLKAIAKVDDKFGAVAEFVYIIRKDPELSFEKEELTVEYTDDYILGVWLNNPHNVAPIKYSASDETMAYVDKYGDIMVAKSGECTIYAEFEGNDEYKPQTVSYKLIVIPQEPLETPTISPAGGTFTGSVDVTITAGSDWGERAITIWYSTKAQTQEEMEDNWNLYEVWPEAPGFDYSVNSKTITIEESCRLIAVAKGYNSLTSEAVICDFIIEPNGINAIELKEALKNGNVYNLQGQRVSSLIKGNIYIVNGKKMMAK